MSRLSFTAKAAIIGCAAVAVSALSFFLVKRNKKVCVKDNHDVLGFAPILIGVCGGSGSGKTTVVNHIVNMLKEHNVSSVVLSLDSYYRDNKHKTLEERAKLNFDHPESLDFDLFHKHLGDLRAGHAIQRPTYDFATHSRVDGKEVLLEPAQVIIIDGILSLFDPKIHELYDISVFIDVREQMRLERRTRRDVQERGRTPESVHEQFWATVAPMHSKFVEPTKDKATVVINWEHDREAAIGHVGCELVRKAVVHLLLDTLKTKADALAARQKA